ncbi:MAG: 2-iminoacetate synthase ThiH [Legionellales bacterium]
MFKEQFDIYTWDEVKERIYSKTPADVERAINKNSPDMDDFAALLSPAAEFYLENIAAKSHEMTRKRFGNTMQMYIPMYLSNECQNICTYCGFSLHNDIKRTTLTDEQILREVEVIKSYGYDHILLVSGEAHRTVGTDYFKNAIRLIRPYFSNISMEVQPMALDEYKVLADEGVYAVLVYQETYNEEFYKDYHPKGKKSNFTYRLDTPDRLGKAGIHKIGLGVLIGLEDWRVDSWFCALHLQYLRKKYWQTKYSLSFPRLRPAVGYPDPKHIMNDKELVQLICAYRLFDENLELSLSTRETKTFRNNVIKLGITSISAGSKTDPGGYATGLHALEQFEISDDRSPAEIAEMIRNNGYEPVWKDWFYSVNSQQLPVTTI